MMINNFTVVESVYGRFIVPRHCAFQAEALIKTGRTHIEPELEQILKLVSVLPGNCVFIDAGANIGLISVPVAQAIRGKGGILHAFEVQRMMFNALCGAVALNDLENAHIHNVALGASKSVLKVPRINYGVPQDFGQLSLVNQSGFAKYENVEVVSIDSLQLPRLDFIKIDVEGMEIDVLKGGRRTIGAHHPWAWVEYWKVGVNAIKQQFAGLNYKFFEADKMNMLCAPQARLVNQIKIEAREL